MKKSLLTLAGIGLLSVGLSASTLTNEVHAAKVTAGKIAKVTHTAYVYNSKGKRVKKTSLKKNKTTKVIKIVKIKGKNYAQIGKNQFVKLSNLSDTSGGKVKKKVTKKLSKNEVLGKEISSWGKKHENYSGFKVTAKKDTVMKVVNVINAEKGYAMDEYEVKFPKGTSLYWDNMSLWYGYQVFEDDSNLYYSDAGLAATDGKVGMSYPEDNTVMVTLNKKDVTFENNEFNVQDSDDENAERNVDMVVPQSGSYKSLYVDSGELGLPRELIKNKLLKKATYGAVEAGYLSEKDYLAGKDFDDGSNG